MNIFRNNKIIIKVKPITASERNDLWLNIEQNILQPNSQPKKNSLFALPKFSYIALSLILITFIGSITAVAAAQNSQPGDFLFPVEIAYENLRLALTTKPEQKIKLTLAYSKKRVAEVENILNKSKIIKQTVKTSITESSSSTKNRIVDTTMAQKLKIKSGDLDRTHGAIIQALDYLENVKVKMDKKGNEKVIEDINKMAEQISDKTEEYLNNLDDLDESITTKVDNEDFQSVKEELRGKIKEYRKNENQENKIKVKKNEKDGEKASEDAITENENDYIKNEQEDKRDELKNLQEQEKTLEYENSNGHD